MALTTRNNRNGLAAIAGVVTRQLVNQVAHRTAQLAYDGASTGANRMLNYFTEPGRQANRPMAPSSTVSMSKLRSVRSRSGKGKGRRRGRVGNPVPLYSDRIRVTLSDALTLSNTAFPTCAKYYQIANTFTSGQDMGTWLPRARTISGSFRFFKVKSISLHWRPSVAYTVAGFVVIGVDPDPSAIAPTAIGDVIRHHPHQLGDIKDCLDITWQPGDDTENTDKLCNSSDIVTAPEHISQGTLQFFSSNTIGDNTSVIGVLTYEVDIEFFGLA